MKKTIVSYVAIAALALTFGGAGSALLISCCDEQTLVTEQGTTVDPIEYVMESDGTINLKGRVHTFANTFSAYGFVYNTDVSKAPTIADYIIKGDDIKNTGEIYNSTMQRMIPHWDIDKKISQDIIDQNGAIYVRAFVTVANGATYYSKSAVRLGDETNLKNQLATYKAPQYPDNYTVDIAGWNYRYSWNLSNVHDPSVMLADDGYYYMVQTDASWGNVHTGKGHFFCRRSKDLVNWEFLGATMPKCPDWCLPKINELRASVGASPLSDITDDEWGYWAPTIRNLGNGTYRMYYSIVVPGYLAGANSNGERGMIGMMESTNPADVNSWVDKGYVISSPSDRGKNYNNTNYSTSYFLYNGIDPSYIVTPEGEHWLIYGSWHSGIAALQLNAETGMPLKELGPCFGNNAAAVASYGKRIYSRVASGYWARWQGSEGPEIIYNEKTGYYYLFLAYDELAVAYNTRVLRSKSVTGPFVDITGADRTNNPGDAYPIVTHPYHWTYSANTWVGISHVAVFDDGKGNWYIASQARLSDPNANMLGHVRRLLWTKDGWPIAVPERYGNVPQAPVTADELRGTWDFIDMTYEAGVAKEGVLFEMKQNGTCTGKAFAGKSWEYDVATSTLTIDGQKFIVTRECDYDSNPRRATICFCAYSADGKHTYWAKRLY